MFLLQHILSRPDYFKPAPPLTLPDGSVWSCMGGEGFKSRPNNFTWVWAGERTVPLEAVEAWVIHGDEPEAWEPWRIGRRHYAWLPMELADEEAIRRGAPKLLAYT